MSFDLQQKPPFWTWILIGILALAIRWFPVPTVYDVPADGKPIHPIGVDEAVYSRQASLLAQDGWEAYTQLLRQQPTLQNKDGSVMPPPTRLLIIAPGALIQKITGNTTAKPLAIASLILDSIFVVGALFLFFKFGNQWMGVASACSLVFAPVAMGMGRRALGDTFSGDLFLVSFWFWFFGIQNKKSVPFWLGILGLGLGTLVKESQWIYLPALFVVLFWLRKNQQQPFDLRIWFSPLIALGLGFILITFLCRDPMIAIQIITGHLSRAFGNRNIYAEFYLAGPWYRYLVDYMLVSPVTTACWIVALFSAKNWWKDSLIAPHMILGWVGLITLSCVPHHFDLRYAISCDLVLRCAWPLILCRSLSARTWCWVVLLACFTDLLQFQRIFIDGQVYDPVTLQLIRTLKLAP